MNGRVLKGPGVVQGEGVFLGNPKDSVWEDWGTLGKIRGITTPGPLRILLVNTGTDGRNDSWWMMSYIRQV